jgi:hypothetical protein
MASKFASFKTTKLESMIIAIIIERAILEGHCQRINAHNLSMDIIAAHLNGCPLDLAKLAVAAPFDFAHDLYGICTNINRTSGELGNHFLPSTARRDV